MNREINYIKISSEGCEVVYLKNKPKTKVWDIAILYGQANIGDLYYDEHHDLLMIAGENTDHKTYQYKKVIGATDRLRDNFNSEEGILRPIKGISDALLKRLEDSNYEITHVDIEFEQPTTTAVINIGTEDERGRTFYGDKEPVKNNNCILSSKEFLENYKIKNEKHLLRATIELSYQSKIGGLKWWNYKKKRKADEWRHKELDKAGFIFNCPYSINTRK